MSPIAYLVAHPPESVAAAGLPGLPETGEPPEGADDAAITERLRSMGYVE